MKKTCLTLFVLVIFITMNAQYNLNAPWMQELVAKKQLANNREKDFEFTFKEITDAFDKYWKGKDNNEKGNGYKPFMRWREHWKYSLLPDGTLPNGTYFKDVIKQKDATPKVSMENAHNSGNWEPIGPYSYTSTKPGRGKAGLGRINVAIQDPNNPSIWYVGAPSGGLWKSTDFGKNWTPLTDSFPQLGISGIAINPNDSDIIYISTGDDDRGDSRGIGVWKSIDGGNSWNETGKELIDTTCSEIYIDPDNTQRLWVATHKGLFRSLNAGDKWDKVLSGYVNDIKLKPNNSEIVYAISSRKFYRSINGGESFVQISEGLPVKMRRAILEVTPAAPDNIYVLSIEDSKTFQGLYVSSNSGKSFTKTKENDDIINGKQGYTDLALAVSDTDPNKIIMGSLNVWKSIDGGDNFTKLLNGGDTYTHADIHFMRYYKGKLFCGSDGGVYISDNDGESFYSRNEGLQIGQFYKIANAENSDYKRLVGGTQDNGGFGLDEMGWNNYHWGDGMDCTVLSNSPDMYVGSTQYGGSIKIHKDRGKKRFLTTIKNEIGNWVTPLVSDDEGVVYVGYSNIYKLDTKKYKEVTLNVNMEKVSNFNFGGNIDYLEIDPLNPAIIYAAKGYKLYRSKNTAKGSSWEEVFEFDKIITSIEVNNNDSNIIYITTSGTGGSVYKSVDFGKHFVDISSGLPNVSKSIVRHQKHTDDIYLGANIGVYYKNGDNSWKSYADNMPNTSVTDIEINLKDQVVLAGTYGRGIWKAPLVSSVLNKDDENPSIPSLFNVSNIQYLNVDLSWTASTDNKGVAFYDVYNGDRYVLTTKNTSLTVNELIPGTEYVFKVKARDAAGNSSGFSNEIAVTTLPDNEAPSAPVGLSKIGVSETSVTLNLGIVTDNVGVSAYDIYQDNKLVVTTTSNFGVKVNGLAPITEYRFKVKAKDVAGNMSDFSNEIRVVTLPDTEAPNAAVDLLKTGVSATSVILSFATITDNVGVLSYDIYQDNKLVVTTTRNFSVKVDGLAPITEYRFKVKAKDAAGNMSDFSNEILVATLPDTEPPSAPIGLSKIGVSATSVTLNLGIVTDNVGVSAYDIYQDNKLVVTTTSNFSVKVNGLAPITEYRFKVKAKDAAGNMSNFSNEILVNTLPDTEPPSAPIGLSKIGVSATSVTLNLGIVTDNVGVSSYDIYQDNKLVVTTTRNFSVKVNGLAPITEYRFKVKAKDAAGNMSNFSNEILVNTLPDTEPPSAPIGLSKIGVAATSVTLSFGTVTDNVGVSSYDIYQDNKLVVTTASNFGVKVNGLAPITEYRFKVKAKDAAGNMSNFSNEIRVTTAAFLSSVRNSSIDDLVIYPNPVKFNILNILFKAKPDTKYQILDSKGSVVNENNFKSSIDISNFQAGTYMLKIISQGKVYSKSFVKE